jgi:hypothetical protein
VIQGHGGDPFRDLDLQALEIVVMHGFSSFAMTAAVGASDLAEPQLLICD